ncbi:MAG: TIGR00730 family Rossman fold protein, partial [Clostridia bacterium]|nr:TIGR00730 family Rossman fold protein [Clostridia bacterium]
MKCCIFGAASPLIDQKYIEKTEDLGRFLAKNGHSLVFGAGANGLMGAAARGFSEEKGEIVGVIPHFFRDENIEEIFEDCTEIVYTETMQERKFTMEELADCFIIVPGGIGTFEVFFEVLTLKQLG